MRDEIDIRPASVRDVFAVWALERACFGPDAWGLLEVLAALLTARVRLKAVTADERLIGFTTGEINAREGVAWIATLGVHPQFQRRGIGRRLLGVVEAHLTAPKLKLTVCASNTPAISLYEQFGYSQVSRLTHYYTSGEDGIVMEKKRRVGSGAGKTD